MLGIIVGRLISAYVFILAIRALISFIPLFRRGWTPRGFVLVIVEIIYTITDPPLKLLRKFIPPLRLGELQLDLAFIVLWLSLVIIGPLLQSALTF
ncbi:MAG: YggT family protein [Propionibacteriaceae bacterium]|nr:YggT family protein [Propionibacteriaceae bacterium]